MRSLLLGLALFTGLALAGSDPSEPAGEGTTVHATRQAAPVVKAVHPPGTCAECHTDVHQPKAERACEDCHDAESWTPTFTVEDHAGTAFPLLGAHTGVSCEQCHTGSRLTGLPAECSGCHVDRHRGKLGGACEECHTVEGFKPVEGFDHDRTGFHVDGSHQGLACAACHEGTHGNAMRLVATATCDTCHPADHAAFADRSCDSCHETTHSSFAAGTFDHRLTSWPLERRHKVQDCSACHPVGQAHAPSERCMDCHADPHSHQLGIRCEDCHRADRWSLARFDHDQTGWALRGRHAVAPCMDCHQNQRWVGLTDTCWDCHATDAAGAPKDVPAHRWVRSDCGDCHTAWSWR